MKLIFALLVGLSLSACSTMQDWTEKEKQTAWIVAGVVAAGVIAGELSDGDTTVINGNQCVVRPSQGLCK